MIRIHVFFCMLMLFIVVFASAESPTEEMQMFIDECNHMVDVMNSCEAGWVDFEKSILVSIETFADRIVYTEGLILDEADEILAMSDRIVDTEHLVADLIKSCSCEKNGKQQPSFSSSLSSGKPKESNEDELMNHTKSIFSAEIMDMTDGRSHAITESLSRSGPRTRSMITTADHCQPMDYAISVLDSCISTFETFNDDFLALLEYLDDGIEAMGDQIVITECLIIDMSKEIGLMADQIVVTEELMANLTHSCCIVGPGGGAGAGQRQLRGRVKRIVSHSLSSSDMAPTAMIAKESDVPTCKDSTKYSLSSSSSSSSPWSKDKLRIMAKNALSKLHSQLTVAAAADGLRPGQTNKAPYSTRAKDVMPCETFWNPFCCAAEVCANMIEDMMAVMMNGADSMTQIIENCSDEIALLSDDILKMEAEIVHMGDEIVDMGKCIVHFISLGTDAMTMFCEVPQWWSAGSPTVRATDPCSFSLSLPLLPSSSSSSSPAAPLSLEEVVSYVKTRKEDLMKKKQLLSEKMKARSSEQQTLFESRLGEIDEMHQSLRQRFLAPLPSASAAASASASVSLASSPSSSLQLQSNPFGEFAEMVDVCMRMCELMATMMTDQLSVMHSMWDETLELAGDIDQTISLIGDMAVDITKMMDRMQETEQLMVDLIDCLGQ